MRLPTSRESAVKKDLPHMPRWPAPALLLLVAFLITSCADQFAPTVTPTPLPDPLEDGVLATFDVSGQTFNAFLTDEEAIEELFRVQAGESQATIPNAVIIPGDGAGDHNAPWSWHMQRQTIKMVETAEPVCNGNPQEVEADPLRWLVTLKRYCPWDAVLVDVVDYR